MVDYLCLVALSCFELDNVARCRSRLVPLWVPDVSLSLMRNVCMMDFLCLVAPSCFELDNVARCRNCLVRLLCPGCQPLIK